MADSAMKVKVTADVNDFTKGLKKAAKDASDFGKNAKGSTKEVTDAFAAFGEKLGGSNGVLSGISKAFTGLTGAATVAAGGLVAFATEAKDASQQVGDRWNLMVGEMKAGWQEFVRTISTGQSWKGLIDNVANARAAAKSVIQMEDELFERWNSYRLQEAAINLDIANLRRDARDTSKSDEERLAAANAIKAKEMEIAAVKKSIYEGEITAYKERLAASTKLNDQEMTYLIDEYNQHREIINAAQEYNNIRNQYSKAQNMSSLDAASTQLMEFNQANAANIDEIKFAAEALNKYNVANDKMVESLVNARVALINVDTEMTNATSRTDLIANRLTNAGKAAKGMKEEVEDLSDAWDTLWDAVNREDREMMKFSTLTDTQLNLMASPLEKVLGGKGLVDTAHKQAIEIPVRLNVDEKSVQITADEINSTLQGLAMDVAGIFGEAIGNAFTGGSADIGKDLLSAVGGVLVKFGELAVSTGWASEGIKEALELKPELAIGAGLALIALGGAVSAAASNIASGGSYSSSIASSYTASGVTGSGYYTTAQAIKVEGEFKLNGTDLVASVNATNSKKSHTS